jgi:hypothetical protein
MPLVGAKPKPDGQKRTRVKPVHAWVDIVDVPYQGEVPPLPEQPRHLAGGPPPPEPSRLLGHMGSALWARVWHSASGLPVDAEALLVVCEQMDERVALRVTVLRDKDWRNRTALRAVDQQIAVGLSSLGLSSARSIPIQWPQETKKWWRVISQMPHCVMWTAGDWQFALDTAMVAAAFHAGDVRVANELRQREKIMGTTGDARRDLRIRYVESADESADPAVVTAMDAYRRAARGNEA